MRTIDDDSQNISDLFAAVPALPGAVFNRVLTTVSRRRKQYRAGVALFTGLLCIAFGSGVFFLRPVPAVLSDGVIDELELVRDFMHGTDISGEIDEYALVSFDP